MYVRHLRFYSFRAGGRSPDNAHPLPIPAKLSIKSHHRQKRGTSANNTPTIHSSTSFWRRQYDSQRHDDLATVVLDSDLHTIHTEGNSRVDVLSTKFAYNFFIKIRVNNNMKPYMPVVSKYLNLHQPKKVLDCPAGNGWLQKGMDYRAIIHGVDLYESKPENYDKFYNQDLDKGIIIEGQKYDAVISCEGIEHLGNPLLFLTSAFGVIKLSGHIIIITPNTWHPASKIKYFLNGFFLAFHL